MHVSHQECFHCKKEYPASRTLFWCPDCGGSLVVHYKEKELRKKLDRNFRKEKANHWKYWMFYPVPKKKIVTMGEGGTPIVEDRERKDWFFKIEGENPTGSFKDRGSTVEITHARHLGVKRVACASTGNMGASVSAYAARVGIKTTIYVPKGATIIKKEQIKDYGARIVRVNGDYTDALEKTQKLWTTKNVYLTGDYLYRQEGQKSVILEAIDQMESMPKYVVLPVGMGNLCYATYKGLKEMKTVGLINRMPRIVAVQSYHCSTVVEAFLKGRKKIPWVEDPETIASAICCGRPNYGEEALHALRKTKGKATTVTDREIVEARDELAEQGIFAESSGAASYAGAKKLRLKERVLMVITGHGLKDVIT